MTKLEKSLNLLDKALNNLLKLSKQFDNKEIKITKINGKLYKKINLSSYQVADAMIHFATQDEINEGICKKANTLIKEPYRQRISKADSEIKKNLLTNVIENELDYTELTYRYGVLAAEYAKQKDEIKFLKDSIKVGQLNTFKNTNKSKIILTNNTNDTQTEDILTHLLELLSENFLISVDEKIGGNHAIYFEHMGTIKKICNMSNLSELNIYLNEERKFIQKNILKL